MDWTKTGFGLWCLTPLSTIFQLYRESVLLVEETGVPRENHRPVASHWQTLSHNVVSSTPRHELKQDYLNLLNIYITKTLMASVRLLHLCSIYQLVSYAHQWRHDWFQNEEQQYKCLFLSFNKIRYNFFILFVKKAIWSVSEWVIVVYHQITNFSAISWRTALVVYWLVWSMQVR